MNRATKYYRLIGLVALLGLSNTAYGACTFDPGVSTPPDGVSDLSGQGNFFCGDFIGSNGLPMTEVTGVVFDRDGIPNNWELPENEWLLDANGFVTNTPDQIVLHPRGQGSRCNYSYFRINAVEGTGLDIGGNIDPTDSIACTDGVVNVDEVILPEPVVYSTTGDGCDIDLAVDDTSVNETDFDLFIAMNLEGTNQAVCKTNPNFTQSECVKACPEFKNVEELQDAGYCQSNGAGFFPLHDSSIPDSVSTDKRCTPCLTAAQAEATIPGFDAGGLKLCWEHTNSVNVLMNKYRPHKQVRSQVTETIFYNECYEVQTTISFFGREIQKTITVCDDS